MVVHVTSQLKLALYDAALGFIVLTRSTTDARFLFRDMLSLGGCDRVA